MFKNLRWSEIGELKTATYRLNAFFVRGKFFISDHFLRWVKNSPISHFFQNKNFSNVEVYEFKDEKIFFTENAANYTHNQFDEQAPLFPVDDKFCT